MNTDTLVIWNPNAGSVAQAADIRQLIEQDSRIELYEPNSAADARKKVELSTQHGSKLVIAAGGDGTINSVINGLSGAPSDTVLGVLPLGTANDWCASLSIPNDIQTAWEVIERRTVRAIDVVELETRLQTTRFANIATGGNSHRVTEQITAEMKQRWGALCYIRGAFTILNDLESFRVEISFDQGPIEVFDAWNLMIANGRTSAGRVEVAPRARLDDGLLDVVIIQSGTMIDLADLSARYLFSDYIESDQVLYRQARMVTLNSKPPLIFSLDGDLIDEHPVSFRCLPNRLNVFVGPEYDTP
ncbi:MAG: diacylglycerol kinase family lipid kinase [Pirellulaceae bacterium]|nr:diacylglycerol kinase family lipid kinase [Pirellulaceae bacterium]